MAEDSDLERTEDPSPRRLEDARNKGQIARSQELVTFAVVAAGMATVFAQGDQIYAALKAVMIDNLRFDQGTLADQGQLALHLYRACHDALLAILPLLGITVAAAVLASIMLSGWLFTFEPLTPNFGKLNPANGLGRMFSVRSLVEMGKAILKSGLIGGIAALTIWHERDQIIQLIAMPPFQSLLYVWHLLRFTMALVVGSMLIIVLIDVPFQLWDYHRNLRMTKEEVRQEAKESDGDPQVKAKIRQLQMQAARQRMMSEIPKANVVVTNPTHYAVALRYDDKKMSAPKVVAKGSFLLAERIIELGREHQVPILRTPPLARALYHHADLGDDIPSALYNAVAEVLAYIYQLNHFRRHGGIEPSLAAKLPVPEELDPGS
ncbi:flagellar biosynthesis protein FlhB [Chitinimonas sp.]|uniref:flagellar biosynthesis protein FlhB n=1 Tax=Chitinimonas sp. TaxID=1934313 RepID=UPI0035B47881